MKQIVKEAAPDFFNTFVAHKKPVNWEDISPIRQELRAHILEEQNSCCAYTEIRLTSNGSCHIDHYRTRHLFPEKTFDYFNMLVSCNSEKFGAKFKDKQIASKANYDDLINPVEERPSDYIEFAFTGDVLAISDAPKGYKTIDLFNLNEKSLLERRKVIALCVIQMKDYLSEEEIVETTGEFESMVRQLYKDTSDFNTALIY